LTILLTILLTTLMNFVKVSCVSLALADAMRQGQRQQGKDCPAHKSDVNLYTWGAPAVSYPALETYEKECFKGFRMFNTQTTWMGKWIDVVPALAQNVPFEYFNTGYVNFVQPRMNAVGLSNRDSETKTLVCGNNEDEWLPLMAASLPSVILHFQHLYSRLGTKLGGSRREKKIEKASKLALPTSYMNNRSEVVEYIKRKGGWELLAHIDLEGEIDGQQVTILSQDPEDGSCWLTFEGSSDLEDWVQNANVDNIAFCGLSSPRPPFAPVAFHAGFVEKVRETIESKAWKEKIAPHMLKCAGHLNVAGHSLGGAMATLVAACIQNACIGDKDYNLIFGA